MSNNLTLSDHALIDEFESQARALMPHMDDLHNIDTDAFSGNDLSNQDIEDYFFTISEYLGGMAAVINATIEAGYEAADELGIKG